MPIRLFAENARRPRKWASLKFVAILLALQGCDLLNTGYVEQNQLNRKDRYIDSIIDGPAPNHLIEEHIERIFSEAFPIGTPTVEVVDELEFQGFICDLNKVKIKHICFYHQYVFIPDFNDYFRKPAETSEFNFIIDFESKNEKIITLNTKIAAYVKYPGSYKSLLPKKGKGQLDHGE